MQKQMIFALAWGKVKLPWPAKRASNSIYGPKNKLI
jgi:hypothetical protein